MLYIRTSRAFDRFQSMIKQLGLAIPLVVVILMAGTGSYSVSGASTVPASFAFNARLTSGSITDGLFELTSGSVTIGSFENEKTFTLIGPAVSGCAKADQVCTFASGVLSAYDILLNGGYFMSLASCYTQNSSTELSLSFKVDDASCGGSTALTVGFDGPVFTSITATGKLTISGTYVAIFGYGTATQPLPPPPNMWVTHASLQCFPIGRAIAGPTAVLLYHNGVYIGATGEMRCNSSMGPEVAYSVAMTPYSDGIPNGWRAGIRVEQIGCLGCGITICSASPSPVLQFPASETCKFRCPTGLYCSAIASAVLSIGAPVAEYVPPG